MSGELDELSPYRDEFSGMIEPENKRNDSDMEIREDDGEDTEVDTDSKSDVFSESG